MLQEDLHYNLDGTYNPEKLRAVNMLLDNYNTKSTHLTHASDIDQNAIKTIIKTTVANTVLWDIVGVIPMSSPTMRIANLRMIGDKQYQSYDIVEARSKRINLEINIDYIDNIYKSQLKFLVDVAKNTVIEHENFVFDHIKEIADITYSLNINQSERDIGNELIDILANAREMIYHTSQHGFANWAICHPSMIAYLEISDNVRWKSCVEKSKGWSASSIAYRGIVDSKIRLYSCDYFKYDDPIILGYKGSRGSDTAIQWCPYELIYNKIINPVTFHPSIACMSRFGLWTMEPYLEYKSAKDYYSLIQTI